MRATSPCLRLALLLCALALFALGCSRRIPEPAAPLSPPTVLCRTRVTQPCRPVEQVQRWLRQGDLQILGASKTHVGIQGAHVLTLAVREHDETIVFRAKWRPQESSDKYSSPRRELAAYAMQSLFLDPEQFIVPPTTGRCFELGHYRARVQPQAEPSFAGTRCAFGVLSYWLEDARGVEDLFNAELFRSDSSYRRMIANLNLLTYLMRHGDTHPQQFVAAGPGLWIYSVDNSIGFDSAVNPSLSPEQDWSKLRVPALPRASLDRLRSVSGDQLAKLYVMERYDNQSGMLVPTDATARLGSIKSGIRWGTATQLQVGLNDVELDGVRVRLEKLMAMVDAGQVKQF